MAELISTMRAELQRRSYKTSLIRPCVWAVENFIDYSGKTTDQLSPKDLEAYATYLLHEAKVGPFAGRFRLNAVRLFFVITQASGPDA